MTVRQLAKKWLLKSCGPELRHTLRRAYILNQIMHRRHRREPEMALTRTLVGRGDSAFDIGANVGIYTSELSHAVGPSGKVHSFEPVSENYDILTALIRKARFDNVIAHRLALGAAPAECEILIPDMDGFLGYYWAHVSKQGESGRKESVKMTAIDELCGTQSIDSPDFIKCDVEGGEMAVILGGQKTIQGQLPGWLIEVSRETSEQLFSALHDFGYRAFVLQDSLIETSTYLDAKFSNYFFLHPKSLCWERVQAQ